MLTLSLSLFSEYITWATQIILNAVPCDYVPEDEDDDDEEEEEEEESSASSNNCVGKDKQNNKNI